VSATRGLAISPGGQLYVTNTGDEETAGSIIEILNPLDSLPIVRTLVSGLPNVGEEGEFTGVDGISIFGNGVNFGLYAIMAVDPAADWRPCVWQSAQSRLSPSSRDTSQCWLLRL
jgi:hypothetical protein